MLECGGAKGEWSLSLSLVWPFVLGSDSDRGFGFGCDFGFDFGFGFDSGSGYEPGLVIGHVSEPEPENGCGVDCDDSG